jgi:arylsulfatase A-like enzyme
MAAAALLVVSTLPVTRSALAGAGNLQPAKPNIVLILVDTLRADHLPFYGYDLDTAPFLSELAARSVVFERAYSSSSYTAPAAASLFSSLYPEHHGVVVGRRLYKKLQKEIDPQIILNRIPEEVETLGEMMKKAGYRTYAVSDNYNVSEKMGFAQGFDRFVSDDDFYKGAEHINGVLSEWADEIREGGSYFLYIHYMEPHVPYHKREPWFESFSSRLSDHTSGAYGAEHLKKYPGTRKQLMQYDSEISYVDEKIKEMFRLFGWDRNTLLIFVSDHGEEFREHGGVRHGRTLFDEVLRIPLFIHDATGRLRPGRVETLVSILDILPTLGEYLGLGPDGRHQGVRLLPLIEGRPENGRPDRALYAHREAYPKLQTRGKLKERHHISRAVLWDRWKLVVDSQCSSKLFDLLEDPAERKSLIDTEEEVAAKLAQDLVAFTERAVLYRAESFEDRLSPEEIEKLKSLGYVQ